jgi:hypothetical protein
MIGMGATGLLPLAAAYARLRSAGVGSGNKGPRHG